MFVKPSANGHQKTQNEKHETKQFSTHAVYGLRHPKTRNVSRNVVSGTCFHGNVQNKCAGLTSAVVVSPF